MSGYGDGYGDGYGYGYGYGDGYGYRGVRVSDNDRARTLGVLGGGAMTARWFAACASCGSRTWLWTYRTRAGIVVLCLRCASHDLDAVPVSP